MTKSITLVLSLLIMSISLAFGQEVQPVPGESVAQSIIDFLASPTGVIVAGGALELVLRFVKSEKSLGILQLVGRGLQVFGKFAVSVGEFLDKILGQRKKD